MVISELYVLAMGILPIATPNLGRLGASFIAAVLVYTIKSPVGHPAMCEMQIIRLGQVSGSMNCVLGKR